MRVSETCKNVITFEPRIPRKNRHHIVAHNEHPEHVLHNKTMTGAVTLLMSCEVRKEKVFPV